jgi:hypothetical protein
LLSDGHICSDAPGRDAALSDIEFSFDVLPDDVTTPSPTDMTAESVDAVYLVEGE